MNYSVNAWLEQGEPRLGIIHTETGAIQHQWRLSKIRGDAHARPAQSRKAQLDIQQLARELFLISCADAICQAAHNPESSASDACVHCDACPSRLEVAEKQLLARLFDI